MGVVRHPISHLVGNQPSRRDPCRADQPQVGGQGNGVGPSREGISAAAAGHVALLVRAEAAEA